MVMNNFTRAPYICTLCVKAARRRPFSTTSSPTSSLATPPTSGAARLAHRRLIALHGNDAVKFLQGIVTANVTSDVRAGYYAAFLTAPGKVLNDVFIYPTNGSSWHDQERSANDAESGFLVECDGHHADSLLKHLKRHKLRSKFRLRLLDEGELDIWSVWNDEDRWTAHTKAEGSEGELGLTDCRAPGMGRRLLLPPADRIGDDASRQVSQDVREIETAVEAYTIRRYLKGVPEGQAEIPRDDSLPMNYNIDIMGGIDFKKGCYVGQELTIRTHHTGVVRRRVLPIMLYKRSETPPERLEFTPDAAIEPPTFQTDIRKDDARKRPTGKFIAGLGNVGLAMCRLEQMSDLVVSGEGSTFSPADRYFIDGGAAGEVSVKAFVPDWVRGKVRAPKIQRRVE